jgi:hypothetical protein
MWSTLSLPGVVLVEIRLVAVEVPEVCLPGFLALLSVLPLP